MNASLRLQGPTCLLACVVLSTSPLSAATVAFHDSGQRLAGQISTDVAFGDVDGDGDLDAFITQNNSQQAHQLWLNNGTGAFTASPTPPVGAFADAAALADLDADGDLDAVFGEYITSAVRHVWLNQGGTQGGTEGVFVRRDQTAFNWSRVTSFAVGQLDGQFGPDLFAVGSGGANTVWYSTGDDQYRSAPDLLDLNQAVDVALGDLDGDGDLDAFVVYQGAPAGQGRRVYLNQGGIQAGTSGEFSASGQLWGNPPSGTAVALGDLDGDGDLDAYIVGLPGLGEIWINQGGAQAGVPGRFINNGQNLGPTEGANEVALGDVDRDGDLDAVVVRTGGCRIFLNDGLGQFVDGTPAGGLGTGAILAVALGDLDGDGDPDLVLAKSGAPDEVWINDVDAPPPAADGPLFDSGVELGEDLTYAVALGDIDGDGDLDAVTGGSEQNPTLTVDDPNRIWLNQGRAQGGVEGEFVDSGVRLGTDPLFDVALADLDGDDDLDLVAISYNGALIYINQGGAQMGERGVFVPTGQMVGRGDRLVLADFDRDGDPDLLVANTATMPVIFANLGGAQGGIAGRFAAAGVQLTSDRGLAPSDLAVFDADGDGDQDVFGVSYYSQDEKLVTGLLAWFNPGAVVGPWEGMIMLELTQKEQKLYPVDVDRDGDLDLLLGRGTPQVALNDGAGGFSLQNVTNSQAIGHLAALGSIDANIGTDFVQPSWLDPYVHRGSVLLAEADGALRSAQNIFAGDCNQVALGDLDGNGDIDAWFACSGPDRLWFNGRSDLSPVVNYATQPAPDASGRHRIARNHAPGASVDIGFQLSTPLPAPVTILVAPALGEPVSLSIPSGATFVIYRHPTTAGVGGLPQVERIDVSVLTPGVKLVGPASFDLVTYEIEPRGVDSKFVGNATACFLAKLSDFLAISKSEGISAPRHSFAQMLVGQAFDLTINLDLYRRFRDGVLAASPAGQYYADLYARLSPEVIDAGWQSPSLLWQAFSLLKAWEPAVQALVDGQGTSFTITEPMAAEARRFLDELRSLVSEGARATLDAEIAALDSATWGGLSLDGLLGRVQSQVRPGPSITVQPVGQGVPAGGAVILEVFGDGPGPFSFQWYRDDLAISGATLSSLALPSAQTFDAGGYSVTVANPFGEVTSTAATLTVTPAPASEARLLNLSTRALAQAGDNVLIPGFVIEGAGSKRLLIRAVGPTLAELGVPEVLADPQLVLKRFDPATSAYVDLFGNDSWAANTNAAEIATTAATVGAFALPAGSADAALLVDLGPGQYTVVASGTNNSTGIAIVELYDADPASPVPASRLINISNRGFAGVGAEVMIPGFVISPEGARTVLVRAVGPTLAGPPFNVSGTMGDPTLSVFRTESGGATSLLFSNDDWGSGPDPARVQEVAADVGAFALQSGSKDAALVLTLAPGIYTMHGTTAAGSNPGVVLVEIYVVP